MGDKAVELIVRICRSMAQSLTCNLRKLYEAVCMPRPRGHESHFVSGPSWDLDLCCGYLSLGSSNLILSVAGFYSGHLSLDL